MSDKKTDALDSRYAQLRLRDLMLLERIAERGSLRAAAESLHVTQSAVSQALNALEAAFGATLVERGQRGQRGVRLTQAGQAAQARLMVARSELLAAKAAAQLPARAPLRIGALPLAMLELVPAALTRLRRQFPNIEVSIFEATVATLWGKLALGELDAVIGRLPAANENTPLADGIVHWQVGWERLVLAGSCKHPLARKRPAALRELRNFDWAAPPTGSFTRLKFDQLFVGAGLQPPLPVVISQSFHSNLHVASKALLLTVAPETAVRRYQQSLDMRVIAAPWEESDARVVLAVRESRMAQPAIASFCASFPRIGNGA